MIMKRNAAKIFLFGFVFLMAMSFVHSAPTSLFKDDFDTGSHPFDNGWKGYYPSTPDSENISEDIFVDDDVSLAYNDYYMGITDNAAAFREISTKGYENIKISYARRVYTNQEEDSFDEDADTLHVDYRIGDSDNWTNLESTSEETWDVVNWTLPNSASDIADLQIRFYLENANYLEGTGDFGLVDNVFVRGDGIPDTEGPKISTRKGGIRPFEPMCTDNVTFCSTVIDDSEIDFVKLHFKSGSGSIEREMDFLAVNRYCTTLSATEINASDAYSTKYEFFAADVHGNTGISSTFGYTYDCAAPTASITCNATSGTNTLSVRCQDTSTDTVDSNLDRIWSTNETSRIIELFFGAVGTYFIDLTVTDDQGNTDTATQEIVVSSSSSGGGGGGSGSGTTITTFGDGTGSIVPVLNQTVEDEILQSIAGLGNGTQVDSQGNGGFTSLITGAFLNEAGDGLSPLGIVLLLILIALVVFLLYRFGRGK